MTFDDALIERVLNENPPPPETYRAVAAFIAHTRAIARRRRANQDAS